MLGDRTILQRSFDIVDAPRPDRRDRDRAAARPGMFRRRRSWFQRRKPVRIVDGGARRQDSVANAFAQVSKSASIDRHSRRRAAVRDSRSVFACDRGGGKRRRGDRGASGERYREGSHCGAGLSIVARTIARESIYLAQTPQAFSPGGARGCDRARAGKHPRTRPTKRRWPSRPATRCGWLTGNPRTSKSRRNRIWTCRSARRTGLRGSGFRTNPPATCRHRLRPASPRSRQAADYRRRGDSARDGAGGPFGRRRAVSCGDRRDSRRSGRRRYRPALSRHRSEMEGREQHRTAERRGRRSFAPQATWSRMSTP